MGQAIESVLGQTYPEIELIVIDGDSQDESLEVIRRYAEKIAYWVSEPDCGQSHAINKGFARATGEIITFLSSDDYYLPGTFADVAEKYRQNPASGAITGAFCFWDDSQPAPGAPIPPFLGRPSPCDLTLGPPGIYRLHQVATFYTRAALDAVGRMVFEDLKYVMDRELLYRVCRYFPLTLSSVTYGVFRRHPGSKSVAEILPFACEFAHIYREALTGDSAQDRQRHKMASYRLSRGYVKYAGVIPSVREAFFSLLRSAWITPELILSRGYWKQFSKLFLPTAGSKQS